MGKTSVRKVGLEEHLAVPETVDDPKPYMPEAVWPALRERLLDIHGERLALMDANGIEMMVLSLNSPAVQRVPDVRQAVELARRANDALAGQVARRPDRFAALGALPMQDPQAAAQELTRCIKDLGFKGAMVNGFSQVGRAEEIVYYDLERYRPFWEVVQDLDVPFYLHPRDSLPAGHPEYEGHPWLRGASWAFGAETAVHALRLMASGLFDAYPRLKIVLGHLGEGLPYGLWRVDHRIRKTPSGIPARRPLSEYFGSNFHVTTSGNFRTQSLIDAILEIGADRLLFSTDYPFEEVEEACAWFDSTCISEADRVKIGRSNAVRLFKLELP